MTDDKEITIDEKKNPVSGYVSVVLTAIALIMLIIIRPMGITSTDETGLSVTFVGYLFVSMTFAIVGGFFSVLGLSDEHSKKIFPLAGIILAVIFIAVLAYIIASSVM